MPTSASYHKKWKYDRHQGKLRLADTQPARLHIAFCLGAGMSLRAIAGAGGLSVSAVHHIHLGQEKARRATIAAILAVEPGVTTEATPDTTEPFVPKVGAVRRIQALIAIGYPHHEQQRISGVQTHTVLSQRGRWITASTHPAIARMYDDLSMVPGPSSISRARAAARGYAPPLAWDDIDRDEMPTTVDPLSDFEPIGDDDFDEVVVQRRLDGDTAVPMSKAERRELARRWAQLGRPLAELERLHGINAGHARQWEAAS